MKKRHLNLNQTSLLELQESSLIWPQNYTEELNYTYHGLEEVKGVDIETQGLVYSDRDKRIISIGIADTKKVITLWMFEFYHSIDSLRKLLENPNNIIVGHNIKFDINWIKYKLGIEIKCEVFDTQTAMYFLNENSNYSLEKLVDYFFKDDEKFQGYKQKIDRKDILSSPKEEILIYNGKDADASRQLFNILLPKLDRMRLLPITHTANQLSKVLSDVETRGVWIDRKWKEKEETILFNKLIKERQWMSSYVKGKFDPNEHYDLNRVLYQELGFNCNFYTEKGENSTGFDAISDLYRQDHDKEFLDHLLEYKGNFKNYGFFKGIDRFIGIDDRVHPNYRIGGTKTGRLTCEKPNFQQFPRDKSVRGMLAATSGFKWLSGDFSQNELRCAAFITQEPVMIEVFNKGLDIHTQVMSDLLGIQYEQVVRRLELGELKEERVVCKEINFGILFGLAADRLRRILYNKLKIDYDIDYCQGLIDSWLNKYTVVAEWLEQMKWEIVKNKSVIMPLGQIRRLPDANMRTSEGRYCIRQGINFPIQSLSAWITQIGMIILNRFYKEIRNAYILMNTHDSIDSEICETLEINNIIEDVKYIMEHYTIDYIKQVFGVEINVPLKFDLKLGERYE